MAKSKFEYVKHFELDDKVLPDTWMVVRIDGRGFHKLTDVHKFVKPNDCRGLRLMNKCAEAVMKEYPEIMLSFGESDEYSFVFDRLARLYQRRSSKIVSNIVSLFTSNYVYHWKEYMGHPPWEGDIDLRLTMQSSSSPPPPILGTSCNGSKEAVSDGDGDGNGEMLQYPPTFDGRLVCYPSVKSIRDYISWRQADCHINNLYNTAFWMLVKRGDEIEDGQGFTPEEAEKRLKGTLSKDKMNEILFTMGINYNNLPQMYRKGSCFVREREKVEYFDQKTEKIAYKSKTAINLYHVDLIGDAFWSERPWLLN